MVWGLSALLGAVAVYVAVTSFGMMARHFVGIPYYDQWQELLPEDYLSRAVLPAQRAPDLLRPPVLRARHLARAGARDVVRGRGARVPRRLRRPARRGGDARAEPPAPRFVIAFSFSVALLLAAYSWECLLWSFQASYVGVCPAALGVVPPAVATDRGDPTLGRRSFVLAALFSRRLIAAYSLASGVIVPLLLVPLAILAGPPRWQVALLGWLALGVLDVPARVRFADEHADPAVSALRPGAVLRYVAVYLGGPFTERFEPERVGPARIFGAVGLVAYTVLAAARFGRPRRYGPEAFALPLAATFALGWAFMTALGRVKFPSSRLYRLAMARRRCSSGVPSSRRLLCVAPCRCSSPPEPSRARWRFPARVGAAHPRVDCGAGVGLP